MSMVDTLQIEEFYPQIYTHLILTKCNGVWFSMAKEKMDQLLDQILQ